MVNNTEKYTYYTCRSMVRTKKKTRKYGRGMIYYNSFCLYIDEK